MNINKSVFINCDILDQISKTTDPLVIVSKNGTRINDRNNTVNRYRNTVLNVLTNWLHESLD